MADSFLVEFNFRKSRRQQFRPYRGIQAEDVMKHFVLFSFLLLAFCSLTLTVVDTCEAARMGGGRSFGSSPTMRAPTAAPSPMTQRQQPMATPQTAPRPTTGMGGMGAMGGLFGGLLAGTVLGSLLGGGHGAAAAGGGGIGFIDILLLGVLVYFGFKLYRRFQAQQQNPQPSYEQGYGPEPTAYQETSSWNTMQPNAGTGSFGGPTIPPDFNVEEFLQGAKAAYVRMQSSWDQRDLNDIAQFATPAVMEVLREQMKEDPNPSRTEIININTQLMGVTTEGGLQKAQVYFDVLMREDPNQVRPEPAREIWHFIRTLPDGTWKLDGIQQTY